MGTSVALFLLTAAFAVCLAASSNKKVVFCNSKCGSHKHHISSKRKCVETKRSSTPWSIPGEVTAPAPRIENVHWFITKDAANIETLAFNISWSQNVSQFKDFVEGYYMSVGKINMFGSFQYVYTFSKKHSITKRVSENSRLFFNVPCQTLDGSIRPGDHIIIDLHAMPIYQAHEDPRDIFEIVAVPDCRSENEEIRKTSFCQALISSDNNDDYLGLYDNEDDDGFVHVVKRHENNLAYESKKKKNKKKNHNKEKNKKKRRYSC